MFAADSGHLDTLKWLVEAKGGDIRAKNKVTPRPFPTIVCSVPLLCSMPFPLFDLSHVFTSHRAAGRPQCGLLKVAISTR